jgi:hypothetical protein
MATDFLESQAVLGWLGQFEAHDQPTAEAMLSAMTLVSRDAFAERMRSLILERLDAGKEPVALYAERELRKNLGVPHRLFKESRGKVRRAFGAGPQPVQPTRFYDPDVGSEGLVAHLISELCREFPKRLISHPGPNAIRKKKIRRFILVTDFIGSGLRAETYLNATWRVRSVRSWWAARKTKGISFEVVAYASTQIGKRRVADHPSLPDIHLVTASPTIDDLPGELGDAVRDLCIRYDPGDHDPIESLGFCGAGSLIAFAHGVPNNAPRILHKHSARWTPLFPKRVTSAMRSQFASDELSTQAIRGRLVRLRQLRLANADWLVKAGPKERANLIVLAALSRPPRTDEVLSRRTGLIMMEVARAILEAKKQGWIDGARRLTDSGQAELAHARTIHRSKPTLPSKHQPFYYPTSLRAPSQSSS